jgi:DNA polymerase (family 10)
MIHQGSHYPLDMTLPMSPKAPSAQLILGIDAEYRKKAAAGRLKKIAPKKLNPEGKAWLPIMSTERERWRFTVLFSNTQRAHDLGKTNDWVVVYYDDGSGERKCTVVTEFKGELNGKRVIRGREKECGEYYETGVKKRTS